MPPHNTPGAADDDSAPARPTRQWDDDRHVWVEARTNCRDTRGRYAPKSGNEPPSVLLLFPDEQAA